MRVAPVFQRIQIMKNLNRIFIACLTWILISSFQSNAQTFGIHAGIDFLDPIDIVSSTKIDININPVYKFGPTMDVQLSDRITFTTGLWAGYHSNKIKRTSYSSGTQTKTINSEIPILFRFLSKPNENRFFIQFGSTLSNEIFSSSTSKNSSEGTKSRRTFSWVEFGSQLGLGVESETLRIGIDFKVPMLRIDPDRGSPKEGEEFVGLSMIFKIG